MWLGPTWIEVDLDCLESNFQAIKTHTTSKVCGVLKGDAYGHGIAVVGRFLEQLHIDYLAVSDLIEAKELRKAKVECDILLLTPPLAPQLPLIVQDNITPTVTDFSTIPALAKEAKRQNKEVKVHLKVDTGMGRLGIPPSAVPPFIAQVANYPNVHLEGIFTHFAAAFSDQKYTLKQLDSFLATRKQLKEEADNFQWHCANSAAFLRFPASHLQMVRIGTLLYGQSPLPRTPIELKPTWSLYSRIVQVKPVAKGSSIGYGRAYTTKKTAVLGVIPVGYAHGLALTPSHRDFSSFKNLLSELIDGRYQVIIDDLEYPIVGKIAMGMCCVDLTAHPNPLSLLGAKVELPARHSTINLRIPKAYRLYNQISVVSWNDRFFAASAKGEQISLHPMPDLTFPARRQRDGDTG